MPLSSGLSIHDDSKHKGSAKRDVVGGVAPLDALGNVEDEAGNDCETVDNKNAVNGYVGLDVAGKQLITSFPNIYQYWRDSADVIQAHDSEVSTYSATMAKRKTITIDNLYPSPSLLTISFAIRTCSSVYTAYGQIYKNGSPVGILRSTTNESYVTYTEDISFEMGDTIELWSRISNVVQCVRVRQLRVYGEVEMTYKEAVMIGDVGVAVAWDATNS